MDGSVSAYLTRPLRSEAEVTALADRAALYERVLGFDPARARWVAGKSFDERVGHWFGLLHEGADSAPVTEAARYERAVMSLHPDVGAAFWHHEHNRLIDLGIVLDELIDEMPTAYWINLRHDRTTLHYRVAYARAMADAMEREADRRGAGRAA